MTAAKLILPDPAYKDSHLDAITEYQEENHFLYNKVPKLFADFESYVETLRKEQGHPHRPFQDWVEQVPETVLWLVKDSDYMGTVCIRHRLNWHLEKWGGHIHFIIRPSVRGKGFGKKILQKTIPYAAHFGIEQALLTICPENAAAIRVVEFCGARLEDETQETDRFPARRRYWLNCE